MIKQAVLFVLLELTVNAVFSQNVTGIVLNRNTLIPVEGAAVQLDSLGNTTTSPDGLFKIRGATGNYVLKISAKGFQTIRMPITIPEKGLDVGSVFLFSETSEETANLVEINLNQLTGDDQNIDASIGVFQESVDLFQRRAAFDFGQLFFRIRGYSTRENTVLINGIPMNTLSSGSTNWAQWSGLNDITRNQDVSFGLSPSSFHFGSLLGTTNILIEPETYSKELRLTASIADRTFTDRQMLTYHSGKVAGRWAFSLSASRRAARRGYRQGTPLESYSVFAGASYSPSENHVIGLIGFYTPMKRGLNAAITEEARAYTSATYNPYWGLQSGKIRNSRMQYLQPFMIVLNHKFQKLNKIDIRTAVSFQKIMSARSRLDYQNAPNPDPLYYRKMPSYFEGGAGVRAENITRFKDNSQIDWPQLYAVNQGLKGGANAYTLYDDVASDQSYRIASSAKVFVSEGLIAEMGINGEYTLSENYAVIEDLLGGEFYNDINVFTQSRNNTQASSDRSQVGDKIKYHYNMRALQANLFAQVRKRFLRSAFFLAAHYTYKSFQREGLFQNELYANSLGKSPIYAYHGFGAKAGVSYEIFPKQRLSLNLMYRQAAPLLQALFYNARETNNTLPGIRDEQALASELNYIFKSSSLSVKGTLFGSYFYNTNQVNYFYANLGQNAAFFQELATGVNELHMGVELGAEYDISDAFQVNAAMSVGQYIFTDNPNIRVNFNPLASTANQSGGGSLDLGTSFLKNYASVTGPAQVFSLGVKYNSPWYWWVAPTAVFSSENYVSVSKSVRTSNFFINPDDPDGYVFSDISEATARELLRQKRLPDAFIINIIMGKSFRIKGKYLGMMLGISNLLNTGYISGGYEQTRNTDYEALRKDYEKQYATFGPRLWYGTGRTFFLNVSFSF